MSQENFVVSKSKKDSKKKYGDISKRYTPVVANVKELPLVKAGTI